MVYKIRRDFWGEIGDVTWEVGRNDREDELF